MTSARLTDALFLGTVFSVTFEQLHWNVAGTVSLADVLTILFLPTGLMGIPQRIRQRQTLSGKREDVKEIAPVTS